GFERGVSALRFVLLLGVVSLFADMTYEGARSITGPYLEFLGAGAAVIGFVAGLGEFIGYGTRIVSGHYADRTSRYWLITFLGYGLNLFAVPLLALANRWELAALLIIFERLGKGIRTPARDAMLSYATARMGRGWGFGLHEALDQIGAVLGPLIVALALLVGGGYREAFAILTIPAALSMLALTAAKKTIPQPQTFEYSQPRETEAKTSQVFRLYMVFVSLSVAGFAHFQLLSYHFARHSIMPEALIPVLFAAAMAVDAAVALAVGKIYDKTGPSVLLTIPLLSLPIAPLGFSSSFAMAAVSIILWGACMGVQETIMRAAVATMSPSEKRGFTFGIFNTVFGLAWFVGSGFMGALYDFGVGYAVFFSISLELASLIWFFRMKSALLKTGPQS
ncbi:MAG: MFS transporter, partial [Candidatus Caldarchaeum sp.]|nr:MFS transporter [Candidatus Caldarchaeum sp.]